jgi:hypothetical protein
MISCTNVHVKQPLPNYEANYLVQGYVDSIGGMEDYNTKIRARFPVLGKMRVNGIVEFSNGRLSIGGRPTINSEYCHAQNPLPIKTLNRGLQKQLESLAGHYAVLSGRLVDDTTIKCYKATGGHIGLDAYCLRKFGSFFATAIESVGGEICKPVAGRVAAGPRATTPTLAQ